MNEIIKYVKEFFSTSNKNGAGFINFLKQFKDDCEIDRFTYNFESKDTNIKIALILVGKKTLNKYGIIPYERRLETYSNNGVDRVYILAKGDFTTKMAEETIKEAEEKGLFKLDSKYLDTLSDNDDKQGSEKTTCHVLAPTSES